MSWVRWSHMRGFFVVQTRSCLSLFSSKCLSRTCAMEKTLFPTHFIIQTKPIGEESGIDDKNRFCQCLVKSLVGFLLLVEIDASFPVFSHVICEAYMEWFPSNCKRNTFIFLYTMGRVIFCRSLSAVSSESRRRLSYSSVTDVSFSLLPLLWAV